MALLNSLTRDYAQTTGGDFEQLDNPTLESLKLRLMTQKGSCFWDLEFGSTLHELPRTKIGADVLRDVENRARTALAPMVRAKEILDLSVQVARTAVNRVEMALNCRDAGGRPLRFSTWVAV